MLSCVASSSSCERNWSIMGFVHSKTRNRLTAQRAIDLTWVYHNLRLADGIDQVEYLHEALRWEAE